MDETDQRLKACSQKIKELESEIQSLGKEHSISEETHIELEISKKGFKMLMRDRYLWTDSCNMRLGFLEHKLKTFKIQTN
jgi:hypothetical protein